MADAVGLWIQSIRQGFPPRWLTLCGTSGNGKTKCARRCWKWFKDTGRATETPAGYFQNIIHWPSFVQDLRMGNSYDVVKDMRSWPFLIIDELGGERDTTGFSAEQLSTLLGTRVGKWTMITSNLSIEAIEKFDVRVASRLFRDGGIVVEINSPDYSLRKDRK